MTAQVHEKLILYGEETSMACEPPLPENDSRIIDLKNELIASGQYRGRTSCWREYIGTWEIKDGKFYLVSLTNRYKLLGNAPIFLTGLLLSL